LTKFHNDKLPSVKIADLLNMSYWQVYTRTNSSYRTVQPLATGKNADCGFAERTISKHVDVDRTLTRTTTVGELSGSLCRQLAEKPICG